ncbi:Hypothetical predicted protein [Octopus vulgaris]|uniref:Uncharacterized protein n=1 Tax=Octopus vulgaris TaxID=6645 RepID=A0AA36B8K2_OCTVU|nr:Hypothetical predicted protein [Octopus vulgaris]
MHLNLNRENIEESSNDPEVLWHNICANIKSSAEEVLRFVKRNNEDWFDENDSEIKPPLETIQKRHATVAAYARVVAVVSFHIVLILLSSTFDDNDNGGNIDKGDGEDDGDIQEEQKEKEA